MLKMRKENLKATVRVFQLWLPTQDLCRHFLTMEPNSGFGETLLNTRRDLSCSF